MVETEFYFIYSFVVLLSWNFSFFLQGGTSSSTTTQAFCLISSLSIAFFPIFRCVLSLDNSRRTIPLCKSQNSRISFLCCNWLRINNNKFHIIITSIHFFRRFVSSLRFIFELPFLLLLLIVQQFSKKRHYLILNVFSAFSFSTPFFPSSTSSGGIQVDNPRQCHPDKEMEKYNKLYVILFTNKNDSIWRAAFLSVHTQRLFQPYRRISENK